MAGTCGRLAQLPASCTRNQGSVHKTIEILYGMRIFDLNPNKKTIKGCLFLM